MRRFDPLIQIKKRMQCERHRLSSDHRVIHVVGEADFNCMEQ